ncbi:MAG: DUF4240 domain-containing protein [Zoogloeaceae bacterium]|jgi:hypothetical protein|nr:DUF4240 domain-containing protein [Zoogloeaceae bacterium]
MRVSKLIYIGMLYVLLEACSLEDGMDKYQFWEIVELAGNNDGLRSILFSRDRETVLDFYMQFQERMHESDTGDLWAVADLLNAGRCSDDCFEYFRCWLISQGRETFERALNNPDNLAEMEIPLSEGRPVVDNESFCYIAPDVYKEKTGEDLYEALRRLDLSAAGNDSTNFDWQMYTEGVMKEKFPKMWNKYAPYYKSANEIPDTEETVTEVDIPGIGNVKVGDSLRHAKYGLGVVKTIFLDSPHVVLIQFSDSEEHAMLLDAKYLKKP